MERHQTTHKLDGPGRSIPAGQKSIGLHSHEEEDIRASLGLLPVNVVALALKAGYIRAPDSRPDIRRLEALPSTVKWASFA